LVREDIIILMFFRFWVDLLACIPFLLIFERVVYSSLHQTVELLDPVFNTQQVAIQELIFSDYLSRLTDEYARAD
jgi:hypothetical protein